MIDIKKCLETEELFGDRKGDSSPALALYEKYKEMNEDDQDEFINDLYNLILKLLNLKLENRGKKVEYSEYGEELLRLAGYINNDDANIDIDIFDFATEYYLTDFEFRNIPIEYKRLILQQNKENISLYSWLNIAKQTPELTTTCFHAILKIDLEEALDFARDHKELINKDVAMSFLEIIRDDINNTLSTIEIVLE